ncbi:MAG TPA: iron-containing redox enzyme family protein [Candidatus Acidoferrales bacterium]|nr:iron-containing redox enzyme family protein [Candidatus Acidoferrales bacterium]
MDPRAIVQSVVEEIIQPGIRRVLDTPYFSELREGKLSIRRLQGWSIQHYLHNKGILKAFALSMVKNAHDPDLYNHFAQQFLEEQTHPDLAKRFGLALGLKEEDFAEATPIFECLIHTSRTIYNSVLGTPVQNRASALTSESIVCRYSEEFNTCLRKHYGLGDYELEFFTVHMVADKEHTAQAAELIARHIKSPRDERLVREAAQHTVRIKVGKFEGIYQAYA